MTQTSSTVSKGVGRLFAFGLVIGAVEFLFFIFAFISLFRMDSLHRSLQALNFMNMCKTSITPTPTAIPFMADYLSSEWKTYSNKRFGFSMQYPPDWTFQEDSEGNPSFYLAAMPTSCRSDRFIRITKSWGKKAIGKQSLAEYAKVAASFEIENYRPALTISSIEMDSGDKAYVTNARISSREGFDIASEPVTYVEVPDDQDTVYEVHLEGMEDLAVYTRMIKSIVFMK